MTSLNHQQHLVRLVDQLIDWQGLSGNTHWIIQFSQIFRVRYESVLEFLSKKKKKNYNYCRNYEGVFQLS